MDLNSTLIRAEALFRRFERTVEAIDRKNHFPAPSVRPTKPSTSEGPPDHDSTRGTSQSKTESERRPDGGPKENQKVVSPELRQLLSRNPPKMDKNEVWKDLELVNQTGG